MNFCCDVMYIGSEVVVAAVSIVGNSLVVAVFWSDRKLRKLSNYYIISLAVADLLVGLLGVPFAILSYLGLPKNFFLCVSMLSVLIVLCNVSIFCLFVVSLDRYLAILFPLQYSKYRTNTLVISFILVGWFLGLLVGFFPVFGWNQGRASSCIFTEIMEYDYLAFVYFSTILLPSVLIIYFYSHVYIICINQIRLKTISFRNSSHLNSKLSMKPKSQKIVSVEEETSRRKEFRLARKLAIMVLFFMLCWMPLYTMNTVQAFCEKCYLPTSLVNFAIVLSHANSAMNPFLYAYHLKDFRKAMKFFLSTSCLRKAKLDLSVFHFSSKTSPQEHDSISSERERSNNRKTAKDECVT